MKFIWYSVSPWAPTGYGVVTRQIVPRLIKDGHEVSIATKHPFSGHQEWNGADVFDGQDQASVIRQADRDNVDYVLTLLDIHSLVIPPRRWVVYCPIDMPKVMEPIGDKLWAAQLILAMSKHGQKAMAEVGYSSMYVPHGVDNSVYNPSSLDRMAARRKLGWDNNFVVGSIGLNYAEQRKNFVNLLLAFKTFHDRHQEARLFMSCNLIDDKRRYRLPAVAESLGLEDFVMWANPDDYFRGDVSDTHMANRYRAMDVFCLPTKGEGFGLPLVEAQACGCPILTTDTTTGPELTKGGWLIKLTPHDWEWFNDSWRANASPSAILDGLETAFDSWEKGELREVGMQGHRAMVDEYDWEYVYNTYWKPVLKELSNPEIRIRHTPDYQGIKEKLGGRLMMSDCRHWCNGECEAIKFPLLPGELPSDRSILYRSYPILPDEDGKLMVDTTCPLHKWISRRFVKEATKAWDKMWEYPTIRKFIAELDKSTYIPLDSIKIGFNDEYKWAMQTHYVTMKPELDGHIPSGAKLLDVGCGDGKMVRQLREQGIDAIGVEANEAWVDDDAVIWGDAENLQFENNSFDIVMSIDVLEHLENPLTALSEMFRVGRKVIVVFTPTEDKTYWEDPTHKVDWDMERWMRELNEFGEITERLKPSGFVIEGRK